MARKKLVKAAMTEGFKKFCADPCGRLLAPWGIGILLCDLIYQTPTFFMEVQGSSGGFGLPFWSSSIEILSGDRTKAM